MVSLFIPLILFIMVRSFKYISSIYFNMFLFLVIISQLTGMYNTFNRSQTDWFYVKSRIEDFMDQNKDARVLLDGRSSQPIKFYLGNNLGKTTKLTHGSLRMIYINSLKILKSLF